MSLSLHKITFSEPKVLSVELEFIIACNKVEGNELIKITLENTEMIQKFKSSATRHLRSAKKDGAIRLFVFEDELTHQEKTESVYLLNKYPTLGENCECDPASIYIKL